MKLLLRCYNKLRRVVFDRFCYKKYISKSIVKTLSLEPPTLKESAPLVLFDLVESYPVVNMHAMLSKYFGCRYGYLSSFVDSSLINTATNGKFESVYKFFSAKLEYEKSDISVENYVSLFISELNSKEQLIEWTIDGVLVGDLVYDTYLRRLDCATVDLSDPILHSYIYQACMLVKAYQDIFSRYNVRAVFPGDTGYIYSGCLARTGLFNRIPVYSTVERPGLLFQKMDPVHLYRRQPFWKYRSEFLKLPSDTRERGLVDAKKYLSARLSGETDANVPYMVKSSFSGSSTAPLKFDKSKTNIVVFLHCFLDSPHIYRSLIFADFWEWICETLKFAETTNYDWYVKPHPNGLPGNINIVNSLKNMFPNIDFIDPKTSNSEIVNAGMTVGVTGYGSVSHEFPYLGIPVICAGDNPHVDFKFCLTPSTKKDYFGLIDTAENIDKPSNSLEIEEFYYMHYLSQNELDGYGVVYPNQLEERYLKTLPWMSSKERRTLFHKDYRTLKVLGDRCRDYCTFEKYCDSIFNGIGD